MIKLNEGTLTTNVKKAYIDTRKVEGLDQLIVSSDVEVTFAQNPAYSISHNIDGCKMSVESLAHQVRGVLPWSYATKKSFIYSYIKNLFKNI